MLDDTQDQSMDELYNEAELPEAEETEIELGQGLGQVDHKLVESQTTVLHVGKESSLGTLPDSPKLQHIIPNSYSAFDAPVTRVTPNELDPTKQMTKGEPVQVTATAGLETDYKNDRLKLFLPGLFSANFNVQRGATNRVDAASSDTKVTAVAADSYTVTGATEANGWKFPTAADLLVVAKDFSNKENNGLKVVTALTATKLTVADLVAESSPPINASLRLVGIKLKGTSATTFDASEKTIAFAGGIDVLGLQRGEWVQYRVADVTIGWGKVDSVDESSNLIKLSEVAWKNPVDVAANTNGELLVASRWINNPVTASELVESSYQFERQLDSGNYEKAVGSQVNGVTLTLASNTKIPASIDFISQDVVSETQTIPGGVKLPETFGNIYNTARGIKHIVMRDANDNSLVGTMRTLTISIAKSLTANFGLGTDSSIGATSGNFALTATGEAYFTDLGVRRAARNNTDVMLYLIVRNQSGAFILDMPLMTIGTATLALSVGQPVTVSMTNEAAKNRDGYTLRWSQFDFAYDTNRA